MKEVEKITNTEVSFASRKDSLSIDGLEKQPVLSDISIIIPTLGREVLRESLYWIAKGSRWPGEIIVVDQSSSAKVAGWLKEFQAIDLNVIHVPSVEKGRARGVNRGLELVQTPFFCVTDDDCFVDGDWLKNIYDHMRKNSDVVVTGRVEATGTETVAVTATSKTSSVYTRPGLVFDRLSGGNMGASMSVVDHVGYFDADDRISTAEDVEWAYRVLRAGIAIHYVPDVMVRHLGWRDETNRLAQYQGYARSHGGVYGKYLRKKDWFIMLRMTAHFLRALRRWLLGIIQRDDEKILHGRAYLTGLLPGIISGLRRASLE